jgi:hypothetical protein
MTYGALQNKKILLLRDEISFQCLYSNLAYLTKKNQIMLKWAPIISYLSVQRDKKNTKSELKIYNRKCNKLEWGILSLK